MQYHAVRCGKMRMSELGGGGATRCVTATCLFGPSSVLSSGPGAVSGAHQREDHHEVEAVVVWEGHGLLEPVGDLAAVATKLPKSNRERERVERGV